MTEFPRTIIIRSDNLGKDTTFMLTLDSEEIPGIFKNVFPTAWKVAKFPKAGQSEFAATFKFSPGVSAARVKGASIVFPPLADTPIKFGEKTSLLKKDDSYYFSTPTPFGSGITIRNETNRRENFGLGIFEHTPSSPPSTLWLYRDVGAGTTIQIARFNHVIRGYVTSDFKEGDILTRQVTVPVLFEEDLIYLDDVTYWKIVYNRGSDTYRIERDDELDV